MNSVKILIGYHKPSVLFKSDILTPIHLGRALATEVSKDGKMTEEEYQWMLDNMIGDDTGDNISLKNRHYNEMTGIYWAWKNYDKLGNPDYIGFMHYRRLFSLTNLPFSVNDSIIDVIEKSQLFNDRYLKNLISQYDILTPQWRAPLPQGSTLYDKLLVSSLNNLEEILNGFPEYSSYFKDFLQENNLCYSNMFIMKKNIFFEYCYFIFPILNALEAKIDYSKDSPRRIGFDSEFITDFFLYKQSRNLKSKTLNKIYYANSLLNYTYENVNNILKFDTSSQGLELSPAFNQNNVPVILACDNNYAPYGAITINSIIQNASEEKNYDIILLHTDISEENQKKILYLAKNKNNISIRILDVSSKIDEIKKDLFVHNFYSIATYFRILIPTICQKYDKVIYLDTDVVTCEDIANLYQINIGDNLLGATPDISAICQSNLGKKMPDRNLTYQDYFAKILGVSDINKYFQAGVLIINVNQCKKEDIYTQFMNKIKEIKNPFYVDQDILNSICYGKVTYITPMWNHVAHIKSCNYFKGFVPDNMFQEYVKARGNPKLIHYTGPEKPWHNPKWVLADNFWRYATQTPFFEKFLFNVVNKYSTNYINSNNWNIDLDIVVYTYFYFIKQLKYKIYKLFQRFCFGKIRNKLSEKLKNIEKKLQKARFLIKKHENFYKISPQISEEEYITGSNLFDKEYYYKTYKIKPSKAIKHYCNKGWLKGYNPNDIFNGKEYQRLNCCSTNPLLHYIHAGKQLGHYVCLKARHQAPQEQIDEYWSSSTNYPQRSKQVIYTCLTGNYDSLINHRYINPEWSYICFTDNEDLLKQSQYGIWQIKKLVNKTDLGNILNNRYHKILPYELFNDDVEQSIYVDSNCNILTPTLFNRVKHAQSHLLIPLHFSTPCLYQEMDWYERHHPELSAQINTMRCLFLADGFPFNYGMTENNIIYRHHSDQKVEKIMKNWWKYIRDYVPRDQLSLSYCLWKEGISVEDISMSNARIDLHNFVFYPHKKGN